jgi:hypothetical protein
MRTLRPILTVLATLCALSITARSAHADISGIQIDQVGWGCASGDLNGRFVQLRAVAPGVTRDVNLRMEIMNSLGVIVSDAPVPFGTHAGEAWPQGQTWLLAPSQFAAKTGIAPDGALAALDRVGGHIALYETDSGGNVIAGDFFEWGAGTGDVRAPFLGQSLQRVDANTFTLQSLPNPTNSAGFTNPNSCLGYVPNLAFRIDEVGLSCASGSKGVRFIELIATSAGVLDQNVHVRYRSWKAGSPVIYLGTLTNVFAAKTGTPVAAGARFLLATPGFASATGVTPDRVLSTLPDSVGGDIQLYTKNAAGDSIIVLHELRYGQEIAKPVPPAGTTYQRLADDSFYFGSVGTPTNMAGATASPGCFGNAPTGLAVQLNEVGLSCQSGVANVSFVEILSNAPGQTFDQSMGLRAYSANGALRFDIPNIFSGLSGVGFAQNRLFLLTTSALQGQAGTRSVVPDRLLPLSLDETGGSIVLYGSDPAVAGPVVVDSLRYGAGGVALPPAGSSLERVGPTTWLVQGQPTPTTLSGVVAASGCFGPVRIPELRISELGLRGAFYCPSHLGYVVLEQTGLTAQTLDVGVGLMLTDANGRLMAKIPSAFGALTGTTLGVGQHVLFAASGFAATLGLTPDITLPVDPDTSGGTVSLYFRNPSTGTEQVLSSVRYGPGGVALPPGGGSIMYLSGAYAPATQGHPTNRAGQLPTGDCYRYVPSPAVVVQEVGFECQNGAAPSRYIDLKFTAHQILDPSIGLRATDADGTLVLDLPNVYAAHTGQEVGEGQHYLIGNSYFTTGTGLAPDYKVNLSTDSHGGKLEIVQRNGSGVITVLSEFIYGTVLNQPPIPAGQAARHVNGSIMMVTGQPAPENLAGAHPVSNCYGLRGLAVRIDEVGLGCFNGTPGFRFIELLSLADQFHDPDITLTIADSHGNVTAVLGNLFEGLTGTPFPKNRRFLIAPRSAASLTPDYLLDAAIDTTGGKLTLSSHDTLGAVVVVDTLSYGTWGGTPIPPGAGGVQRTGANTAVPDWTMTPTSEKVPPTAAVECLYYNFNPENYSIDELALDCRDGSRAASFITLRVTANATIDPTIGVRVRDHAGALMQDLPQVMRSHAWQSSTQERHVLIATPAFVPLTNVVPDAFLTAPLDPISGTIELYSHTPDDTDMVIQRLAYGGIYPRPPHGGSMTSLARLAYPKPRNWLGQLAIAPGCIGTDAPHVRLQEASAGCSGASLRAAGQFMEFVNDGPETVIPSGVALYPPGWSLFTGHEGEPWPVGGTWLVADPDFAAANHGVQPDQVFSFALPTNPVALTYEDPVGGATEFWSLDLGSHFPAPGTSVLVAANGSLSNSDTPTPRNRAGDQASGAPCYQGASTAYPFTITQFSPGCPKGDPATGYVMISTAPHSYPGTRTASNLGLRIHGADGHVMFDFSDILQSASHPTVLSPDWLIGKAGFGAAAGYAADVELPLAFDPAGGAIELYLPGISGLPDTLQDEVLYGSLAGARPPGYGEAVGPNGLMRAFPLNSLYSAYHLDPRSTSNYHPQVWDCFGVSPSASISRFAPACTSGDSAAAFIDLSLYTVTACGDHGNGTYTCNSFSSLPPVARVRSYDAHGAVLDSVTYLQATGFAGTDVGVLGDLLLGGAPYMLDLSALTGIGLQPRARSPHMQTSGGALQMVELGPDLIPVWAGPLVRYGTFAGDPPLVPGRGVDGSGNQIVDPYASDLARSGLAFPNLITTRPPCAPCGQFGVDANIRSNAGSMRVWRAPVADTTVAATFYPGTTRFYRDAVGGVAGVNVRGVCDRQLFLWDGAFTLSGVPAGVRVPVHVRVALLGGVTSLPPGVNETLAFVSQLSATGDAGGEAIHRIVPPVVDDTRVPVSDNADVVVMAQAGVPFRIEYRLQIPAAQMNADLEAQLSFVGLPPGAKITDCLGYGGTPVATGLALATADASDGHVKLAWAGASVAASYAVERRSTEGVWSALATVLSDGDGAVRYDDASVTPGTRYAYRLSRNGAPATSESWIDVPVVAAFALAPISPHPVTGDLTVHFSLPSSGAAAISVFDVLGRRVVEREVGSLGVGAHTLKLSSAADLRAGMYLIRLQRGTQERHVRAVVVR